MIYNKKLKVETDEQNLAVQKKIVEELGNAWIVYLPNGDVYDNGTTNGIRVVCVSRTHYRHFLIDSFGNLVFCSKETYDKSHNEEISLKHLGIEEPKKTLSYFLSRTNYPHISNAVMEQIRKDVKEALKEFLEWYDSCDDEKPVFLDFKDKLKEIFGEEMLE